MDSERPVIIGRVAGVHGIKGWLKIQSYTRPPENILEYSPWLLSRTSGWVSTPVAQGRMQGKGIIARLEDIDDRDQARELIDTEIAVPRECLPALPEGEFYWCDLIGLEVVTGAGEVLGRVEAMRETGANDVMVVQGRERQLLPFVFGHTVTEVDLEAGRIRVDWHGE